MFIMVLSKFSHNEVVYMSGFRKGPSLSRPLYLYRISAGFPSPAEDQCESWLDLNEHMVKNPEATFFLRVQSYSMEGAGIFNGDVVLVDRSMPVKYGSIVIALVEGFFTIKRFVKKGEKLWLQPENPHYEAIEIKNPEDIEIWGVVTFVMHKLT